MNGNNVHNDNMTSEKFREKDSHIFYMFANGMMLNCSESYFSQYEKTEIEQYR